jgi:hypothetical protein
MPRVKRVKRVKRVVRMVERRERVPRFLHTTLATDFGTRRSRVMSRLTSLLQEAPAAPLIFVGAT